MNKSQAKAMAAALDQEAVERGMMYKAEEFRVQFDQLKEKYLIYKSVKFLCVIMVIAVLGMFDPYVYSVIPDKLSDVCMCSFFKQDVEGLDKLLHISKSATY